MGFGPPFLSAKLTWVSSGIGVVPKGKVGLGVLKICVGVVGVGNQFVTPGFEPGWKAQVPGSTVFAVVEGMVMRGSVVQMRSVPVLSMKRE